MCECDNEPFIHSVLCVCVAVGMYTHDDVLRTLVAKAFLDGSFVRIMYRCLPILHKLKGVRRVLGRQQQQQQQ